MYKNNLILIIFFITLINITFNSSNIIFLIIPFIIIFLISISYSSKYLVLATIITYPFMFLIRNSNDSLILILLPEILIFLSFIINFILLDKFKIYVIEKKTFYLLSLFLLASSGINILHVGKLDFIFVFIRLYLFPFLFFLTLASIIKKKSNILLEALQTGILSFGIVAVISLFNYFDLIKIKDFQYNMISGREVIFFSQVKRLDPLISGALGSAGAIIFTLGFILIYLKKEFNKKTNFFFLLVLMLTGILTLSYSIILSIIIIISIIFKFRKNKIFFKILNTLLFFIILLFILNTPFFLKKNILTYISSYYFHQYLNFFLDLSFIEILFGNGMPINTGDYLYLPKKHISDVGMIRIFVETGIINFFVFLYFLFRIFKKLIEINTHFSSNYFKTLFILFILFILLPHSNIMFLPPFYPIFFIVISSVLHEHKSKFSYV